MGPVVPRVSGLPAYTVEPGFSGNQECVRWDISNGMASVSPAGKACLLVHGDLRNTFPCTLTY